MFNGEKQEPIKSAGESSEEDEVEPQSMHGGNNNIVDLVPPYLNEGEIVKDRSKIYKGNRVKNEGEQMESRIEIVKTAEADAERIKDEKDLAALQDKSGLSDEELKAMLEQGLTQAEEEI